MNLELIKTENGKTAVQCSTLYNALGLAPQHYARWIGRNITRNPFAEINKDFIPMKWEELQGNTPPMGDKNQPSKREFVLTLEFAKKLAMISRTEKGEEVRNYFLACEKAVQENTNALNDELLHELETFREIERFKAIRNEANKNIRNSRKSLAVIQENVKQLSYKQLTLF